MLRSLLRRLPLLILGASPVSSPTSGQIPDPNRNASVPISVPGDTLPGDTITTVVLDPVVVTVLRSPTFLSEAPFSVSLQDTETLDLPGGPMSLAEALRGLPGLQVQSRYNPALGEKITLRGAGARTQFGVRGLFFTVDGIPATLPDGQATLDHLDLTSLGGVEVLRGPASALFGNGASGAVAFTTLSPEDERHGQEIGAVAGSHRHRQAHARSSGNLSSLGYAFSLNWLDRKGFRTNPLRPGTTYGSARRTILNGTLRTSAGPGTLSATVNHLDLAAENPGSMGGEDFRRGSLESYPFNVVQGTGKDVRQTQAGLSWAGGHGSLTGMLTAYAVARKLNNPIPPAVVRLDRIWGGIRGSVEREGGWGPVRVRVSLGGQAAQQTDSRKNFENLEGTAGPAILDQDEEVLNTSLSIRGVADLPNRANVLAALRVDRIRFRVRDRLVDAMDPDDSGSRVMTAMTPAIGAFLPVSSTMGFRASLARFFQTPTTSELANRPSGAGGFNPDLQPQRGTGLEVGFRYAPGSRFHTDLTVFLNRVRNELVPFQVPLAPGRTFYRNAGRARHRGFEWAGWASPHDPWNLRWTYSYLDSRFVAFLTDDGDLRGNYIPGVPRHSLDAVLSWAGSRGGRTGNLVVDLRARYRTSLPADDANTATAPPFALFDLRAGWRSVEAGGVRWSPFLRVENLLDREYASSVTVNAFGGRYFEPGSPRALYVGLEAAF